MERETIILSEESQTQTDKCYMVSLMSVTCFLLSVDCYLLSLRYVGYVGFLFFFFFATHKGFGGLVRGIMIMEEKIFQGMGDRM